MSNSKPALESFSSQAYFVTAERVLVAVFTFSLSPASFDKLDQRQLQPHFEADVARFKRGSDVRLYYRLIHQLCECLSDDVQMWRLERYWTVTAS